MSRPNILKASVTRCSVWVEALVELARTTAAMTRVVMPLREALRSFAAAPASAR